MSSSGEPPEGVSGTEVELEYWALGQVGCRGGVLEGERVTVAQCDPHYFGFQIEDMEISLPNMHYLNIDMSNMGLVNKEEVRELY